MNSKKTLISILIGSLISTHALAQEPAAAKADSPKKTTEQTSTDYTLEDLTPIDDAVAAGSGISTSSLVIGGLVIGGLAAAAGGSGGGGSDAPPAAGPTPPNPMDPVDPVNPDPINPDPDPVMPPPPPQFELTSDYAASSRVLRGAKIQSVHQQGFMGAGVTVGVIDSGINNHPEFGDRLVAGRNFTGEGALTDTFDNFTDHGTHVAGIIGAAADNVGTVGAAPLVNLMSLKVFDSNNDGFTNYISDAINFATASSATIINMSLGYGDFSASDVNTAMTNYALAGKIGAISAGNAGAATPENPGSAAANIGVDGLPSFIIVGSGDYDTSGNFLGLSSFSNRAGDAMNAYIVAPGGNIQSTIGDDAYGFKSGTSMSSPVVAGTMAVIWSRWPQLQGTEVVDIILKSADDVGDVGVDSTFGHGLLNVERAMAPIGATSTQIGNQTVSLSSAVKGLGNNLPKGVYSQGQLVFVDSYKRDFSANVSDLMSGGSEERTVSAASVHTKPAAQVKLSSNWAMGYSQVSDSNIGLKNAMSFPFAQKDGSMKQLTTISYAIGANQTLSSGFSDGILMGEYSQKLAGMDFGLAFGSEACSSDQVANCDRSNFTASVQKSMKDGYVRTYWTQSNLNQSNGLAGVNAKLQSFGLEMAKTFREGYGLGVKLEQRPSLASGSVNNVAVGYDQQAGKFILGNLALEQADAPMFMELALHKQIDRFEAVKLSMEHNSNIDGLGQAENKAMVRYSLQF